MGRPRRIEVASAGFDDYRQKIGGSPFGAPSNVGLRIPKLKTTTPQGRYLFLLCSYTIPARACVRLVGLRQLLTIAGVFSGGQAGVSGTYVSEQPVNEPWWSFSDANVSWHVRVLEDAEVKQTAAGPLDAASFNYRWSQQSALLYKTATFPAANLMPDGHPDSYLALTGYTPPNSGQPYGQDLSTLGTFYDLRYPWDGRTFNQIDIPVKGPATIAFFASVKQTSTDLNEVGGTPQRPYPPFALFPPSPGAYTSMETFIQALAQLAPEILPYYWRVGGAMTIEEP